MFLSSDSLVINLLPLVEYVFALVEKILTSVERALTKGEKKGLVVMAVKYPVCFVFFS